MSIWQTSGSLAFLCTLALGVAALCVGCNSPENAGGDQQPVIALPTLVHQGRVVNCYNCNPTSFPI